MINATEKTLSKLCKTISNSLVISSYSIAKIIIFPIIKDKIKTSNTE